MAIKMPHAVKSDVSDRKAEAFISGAGLPRVKGAALADLDAGKTTVNMRFDVALLKRIDEAARVVLTMNGLVECHRASRAFSSRQFG